MKNIQWWLYVCNSCNRRVQTDGPPPSQWCKVVKGRFIQGWGTINKKTVLMCGKCISVNKIRQDDIEEEY